MVAEGEITLGSILKEHHREKVPDGMLRWVFSENSHTYGVSLANGVLVTGGYSFARFMYYGNIRKILHRSVPSVFCLTIAATWSMVFQKEAKKKKDNNKDYVKISRKVPMSRERLTDKNNMPLTEEQLKEMGILKPDSGSDKTKKKIWAEHDP